MESEARQWIRALGLERHPDGGWFRETYRSRDTLAGDSLPARYAGAPHAASTAIYYLLEAGDYSAFHRLQSDELWHFHAGGGLSLHVLDAVRGYTRVELGTDLDERQSPQVGIDAGRWFAAEPRGPFALVSCTVAPGFDFADFEMADGKQLAARFPLQADLIARLTR